MFDTSIVRAHAIAGPRRSTLVVSIAAHSFVLMAAVALTVTSTQLPQQPPKQLELYRATEIPTAPPPPPPLGVPHPARPQVVAPRPQTVHAADLAPQVVPHATPIVPQQPASTDSGPAATTETALGDPNGSPNGVPGGVTNGQDGGTGISTVPVGPYTPGVGGVVQARVITRVEPRFPSMWSKAVREAFVVVRCVIDKNGDIRDPEIVSSSFPPFYDSVITAVRQWKFAPGMLHGQAVDTYFELRLHFEVR